MIGLQADLNTIAKLNRNGVLIAEDTIPEVKSAEGLHNFFSSISKKTSQLLGSGIASMFQLVLFSVSKTWTVVFGSGEIGFTLCLVIVINVS